MKWKFNLLVWLYSILFNILFMAFLFSYKSIDNSGYDKPKTF
jgi:hypothetical protein